MLTTLKRYDDYSWLKNADSSALQQSLRDLDTAYKNFFKLHRGYPKFKSKHKHKQSYRIPTGRNSVAIVNNKIKLPKVGLVKTKLSRMFEGKILNATVSKTASGKYFVSLCVG